MDTWQPPPAEPSSLDAPLGSTAFYGRTLLALVLGYLGLEWIGALQPDGSFWGFHHHGFFPMGVLVAATILLVAVTMTTWWRVRHPDPSRSEPSNRKGLSSIPEPALLTGLSLVAFALFWIFRSRSLLLGDGFAIVQSLRGPSTFHPLEPVATDLQQLAYRLLGPLFEAGQGPEQAAWDAAALGSAVAGLVFAAILFQLARELIASRRPSAAPLSAPSWTDVLLFLVLLAQGYVQIFFGYVEVYAFYAVGVAAFLWISVRHLNGRAPLWLAGAAVAVAVSLHLSAVVLLPPFLVLVVAGIRSPDRRAATVRDIVVSVAVFAAVSIGLATRGEGYDLATTVWETIGLVLYGEEQISPGYYFSTRHIRDFVNLQLLIGPLALAAFLPGGIWTVMHLRALSPRSTFYLVAGGSYLAACVVAGDSNLGYARNWDLLAPAGFVLCVAAMGLLVMQVGARRSLRALLTVGLALSLFHTIPWVGINASSERSLERFYTLPLDRGRMESTVAFAFAKQKDLEQAERWAHRSLEANPMNVRAYSLLGDIARYRENYDEATRAYAVAMQIRPDIELFQLRLLETSVYANRFDIAERVLDGLQENRRSDPALLAARAVVSAGQGRIEEARESLARAAELEPESPAYREALRHFDAPEPYAAIRDALWPRLFPG